MTDYSASFDTTIRAVDGGILITYYKGSRPSSYGILSPGGPRTEQIVQTIGEAADILRDAFILHCTEREKQTESAIAAEAKKSKKKKR